MRETTRTHVCMHACTHVRTHALTTHDSRIRIHACTRGINTRNARERFARLPSYVYIGCPGRKRARPRAGVTLFSNFPFMGYRLVSICRFVTTPGDLHGQIGLLHAVTFPAPPPPFPSPRFVLYNHLSSPRTRSPSRYLAPR